MLCNKQKLNLKAEQNSPKECIFPKSDDRYQKRDKVFLCFVYYEFYENICPNYLYVLICLSQQKDNANAKAMKITRGQSYSPLGDI